MMKFCDNFVRIILLYSFLDVVKCQDFSYGHIHNVTTYKPSRIKFKAKNITAYISYANNPFGSSLRMQQSVDTFNVSRMVKINHSLEDNYPRVYFENIDEDDKINETSLEEPRSKRGVIHLYNMVSCATGCNPLKYKGYGCFCGFLGSGYPVDGIDRCCKTHDWCYDAAKCPMFLEYFVPYIWKCYYNKPLCAIDHGEYGEYNSCASRLCECDRVLSECLSRYPCPSSRAFCRAAPLRFFQNIFMNFR